MEYTREKITLPETMETAYIVDDYPWGFRLRTKQRYWVESKQGFGMRLVTQTLKPKTDKWCKTKNSTYNVVWGLYLNKDGHVRRYSLDSGGWSKEKEIKEFETFFSDLTDFQISQIRYVRASNVANEVTTWKIEPSTGKPQQTKEESNKEIPSIDKIVASSNNSIFYPIVILAALIGFIVYEITGLFTRSNILFKNFSLR